MIIYTKIKVTTEQVSFNQKGTALAERNYRRRQLTQHNIVFVTRSAIEIRKLFKEAVYFFRAEASICLKNNYINK